MTTAQTYIFNDTYNDYLVIIQAGRHICYDMAGDRVDSNDFSNRQSLENYYNSLTAENYDSQLLLA